MQGSFKWNLRRLFLSLYNVVVFYAAPCYNIITVLIIVIIVKGDSDIDDAADNNKTGDDNDIRWRMLSLDSSRTENVKTVDKMIFPDLASDLVTGTRFYGSDIKSPLRLDG